MTINHAGLSALSFRSLQRVRLSIEDVVIKTDEVRLAKDEIEVLQCLRHPETLLRINLRRVIYHHVRQGSVRKICLRAPFNGSEH